MLNTVFSEEFCVSIILLTHLKRDVQAECASRSYHLKGLDVAIFKLGPYCVRDKTVTGITLFILIHFSKKVRHFPVRTLAV